jgi:hypothetical protein
LKSLSSEKHGVIHLDEGIGKLTFQLSCQPLSIAPHCVVVKYEVRQRINMPSHNIVRAFLVPTTEDVTGIGTQNFASDPILAKKPA